MKKTSWISCFGLAVAVIGLAGCTSYDTVDLDHVTRGYRVYCSGLPYATNDDCYNRANEICEDAGYTILKELDPTPPHTQMLWEQDTHVILIKCNTRTNGMQDDTYKLNP